MGISKFNPCTEAALHFNDVSANLCLGAENKEKYLLILYFVHFGAPFSAVIKS